MKGVHLDTTGNTFYAQFVMGCVSIPRQSKTIASECFNNIHESGNGESVALEKKTGYPVLRLKRGFFYRLLRKGGCLSTGPNKKEEPPTKPWPLIMQSQGPMLRSMCSVLLSVNYKNFVQLVIKCLFCGGCSSLGINVRHEYLHTLSPLLLYHLLALATFPNFLRSDLWLLFLRTQGSMYIHKSNHQPLHAW